MDISKIVFLFAVFLLSGSLSFAQKKDTTKVYHLSEVVITATRTKLPELEAASSISVIDSNQIAESCKQSVLGLLKDQYGISFTQQGAPGSLANIYLRGSDAGDTQVLIDGISMNMPNDLNNVFDFADLPVDNIQRIEILRGPQSTLYGSDALAGVINIITKKGFGKPKFYLSGEGGSYNTYKGLMGLNGAINKFNYSVTASRFSSGGFSSASKIYGNKENDGTTNYNVSSRLGYDINKNVELNFYYRYTKANTDLDQHGGLYGDDPTYKYNLEESSFRLEGKISLLDGLWTQTLGLNYMRNVRGYSFDSTSVFNPISSSSIYNGNKIKLEWLNNFIFFENNTTTLGFDYGQENAISYYYDSSPFSSVFPSQKDAIAGIFLQQQINISNSFFSSFGIRYDHHNRFGSVVTYRIAPAYLVSETGTKFKATFGTAFKAPSLFYLFDPSYGNPNLKPEKSSGWDAGIEQYLWKDNLIIGVDYFSTQFKDLFSFDGNTFKEINLNSAESNGIEVYFTLTNYKELDVSLNYTLTNTKDKSTGSIDYNLPLLRRPKNKYSADMNYGFTKKLNLGFQIIYVGERYDKDFSYYPAQRIKLGGYALVNLSGMYHISDIVELYGRVNNLFNKYYEEIFGYAPPGLSAYLGAKFNF
jgi:vitamin B12 transporter